MHLPEESKRDGHSDFTITQKNEIWYQQDGKCAVCHKKLDARSVEYDHKNPWAAKGRTTTVNGRALHTDCHKIETHEKGQQQVDAKTKKDSGGNPHFSKMPRSHR
jgi:5-methylcytosine-specific restriction endonuclease McrA